MREKPILRGAPSARHRLPYFSSLACFCLSLRSRIFSFPTFCPMRFRSRERSGGSRTRSISGRDHEADAMMENQLSAMPSGKPGEKGREQRQEQAMRQYSVGHLQAQTPVKSCYGNEHHGCDGVSPAGDPRTYAGHQKKLRRPDKAGTDAGSECKACRPEPHAQPERVGRPPIKNIRPKRCDSERDGEMHTHRVNRMAGDSNGRTHIFRRNLLIDGIVRRVVFTHGVPPIRPVTNRGVRVFPLLIAMALAGCGGDLSTLDPAGPAARDVARLWWAMLAGSTVLFALVMALFTLVMLKPEAGCRWTPRSWIVGGGIVMPVPILAVLLIFAFAQGERHLPWRGEHNPVRIEARAHMWFWEFHYLDYPEAEPTIG